MATLDVLRKKFSKYLDHTILKQEVPRSEIERVVREAIEIDAATVCIPPYWVSLAASMLARTDVKVCAVIGFPMGYVEPSVRIDEGYKAIDNGARELDTVINISLLKSGRPDLVEADLAGWAAAMHQRLGSVIVKAIIETGQLKEGEKLQATEIVLKSGCDFVKTSTGFFGHGATIEDVRMMRYIVGEKISVKASGGIRDLPFCLDLIGAGADRIGTSSGKQLVAAYKEAHQSGVVAPVAVAKGAASY